MKPTVVVSSDSVRAATTAAALATPVVADARLREIHLGAWQGLTGAEAKVRFPDEFDAWLAGADVRRGNGETYAEVAVRGRAALQDALGRVPDGGTLIAVTHGGTSRAMVGSYLGLPPEHWWRFGPAGNCRWSVLTETGRGWRLAEYNDGAPASDRGDDR
jgi:broad specificity phosphatase PhoE